VPVVVAGCRLWLPGAGCGCRVPVVVAGCRLWLPVAGCRLPVAEFNLPSQFLQIKHLSPF